MKILITGATGQLGADCLEECRARGHEVYGVSSHMFPLSDESAMRAVLDEFEPDAILHAAAYTAVDRAEDEPDLCRLVNAAGTEILARLAQERENLLIGHRATNHTIQNVMGDIVRVRKPFRSVKDELTRNLVRVARVARAKLRQIAALATEAPIKVAEQVMRNCGIIA